MNHLLHTRGYPIVAQWLLQKNQQPFEFQQQAWQHIINGESGLVNAPTGCGKTFAVFLGAVIQFINRFPQQYQQQKNMGLQLLWITPLRALAKDIGRAMEEAIAELGLPWQVGIRNGDTSTAERARQKKQLPEVLIITPESLHLLLAQKGTLALFSELCLVAVDEWHELLGSKRGVQVELAIAFLHYFFSCNSQQQKTTKLGLQVWGISATIGNIAEAKDVLLYSLFGDKGGGAIIKANLPKNIEVNSIYPDEIETYPWAGHLGIKMAHKLLPVIHQHTTTLIFINTRGMSETWYQTLLTIDPDLAGAIALHHGSIEPELRLWVEDNLHTGKLKAVVCTASLDLGVDFRPVDTVIQVGSPKGVARFLQRAGRSGHQPGAVSKIYFLPTHSLELVEVAALKAAMQNDYVESKIPLLLCFDVLIQFLCTLSVGDGFVPQEIEELVQHTYCFSAISSDEWQQVLHFLMNGGQALQQYDEYKKVIIDEGRYKIANRRLAMRHRLHIGTIVSDAMLKVKFLSGGYLGVIEEYFISKLNAGDVFTLAGRNLEFIGIKEMTVLVKKSNASKSLVPSWNGGRMSLTANLGQMLRQQIALAAGGQGTAEELLALQPLFALQQELSMVPREDELLIEQIQTKAGYHLFVYPFEGRLIHEAMAAILAWRISQLMPITFSIAMNDYGFELLADQPIPVDDTNVQELFTENDLLAHIQRSVNATEMAKRKFRDIAVIGGLIFQGMPGEKVKARHLQSSAGLLFNVFSNYEPNNLLIRQAYQEVLSQQMEEARLRDAYRRISKSRIVLQWPEKPTPFCFPILADGLNRNNLTSEKIEDRIKKMQVQLKR